MLFNSVAFLFAFLPIVLGVFLAMRRRGALARVWLLASSLFFYAVAQPRYLPLLLGSIAVNYALALAIQDAAGERARRHWLALGVVANLAALALFKYAHFAVDTWDRLLGGHLEVPDIALPLAISFFTFQQIAYLSDTASGRIRERRPLDYALFVAWFPKLVAGPIVYHGEMMGQVDALPAPRDRRRDVAVGLTLFVLGLFKKVVLADGIAGRAAGFFDAAALGLDLTFLEAWTAALGFTLQVYFDFSGYSDMALGLSRCFGITLPVNFHSPYRANDINEFWRRWHVTLTRWLRLFLFLPISRGLMRRLGERWDPAAVAVAQLVTMALCGLWHGAGWNFVAWGLLHGALLVGHDAWVALKRRLGLVHRVPTALGAALGRGILMATLAFTFVIFRASDFDVAAEILAVMSGARGFVDAESVARFTSSVGTGGALALAGLLGLVWWAPNSSEILGDYAPALNLRQFGANRAAPALRWRPSPGWALLTLAALLASVYSILVEGYEEFIYRFF